MKKRIRERKADGRRSKPPNRHPSGGRARAHRHEGKNPSEAARAAAAEIERRADGERTQEGTAESQNGVNRKRRAALSRRGRDDSAPGEGRRIAHDDHVVEKAQRGDDIEGEPGAETGDERGGNRKRHDPPDYPSPVSARREFGAVNARGGADENDSHRHPARLRHVDTAAG